MNVVRVRSLGPKNRPVDFEVEVRHDDPEEALLYAAFFSMATLGRPVIDATVLVPAHPGGGAA